MLLVCVAAGRSGYLEAESRRPRWFILFRRRPACPHDGTAGRRRQSGGMPLPTVGVRTGARAGAQLHWAV